MNERFLNYIWFNRLFYEEQHTLFGESVTILSPGIPNPDEGPDAFNAKVKISDKVWAGNVEFHVKASDWHRHGHDINPLYNHIILHVVLVADEQIFSPDEIPVPTIILQYPETIIRGYANLLENKKYCQVDFSRIDSIHLHQFLDRLLIERLQNKVSRISTIMKQNHNNWEQAFYIILARAFGFGVNSEAMHFIAQSIPLNIILHHRDNLEQIESLLLGQAGLLENLSRTDDYTLLLQREYNFMQAKYGITPADGIYLKFLRMRPASFPTIRMAQFSYLLHKCDNIFNAILQNPNLKELYKLFDIETSEYWHTHYKPAIPSERHGTHLSKSTVDILIINTVVPFLFHYSQIVNDYELQNKALEILKEIKPEHNRKTEYFTTRGFVCETAYDSQALIQLYDNYCMKKDCLRCQFGHQYLKHQ